MKIEHVIQAQAKKAAKRGAQHIGVADDRDRGVRMTARESLDFAGGAGLHLRHRFAAGNAGSFAIFLEGSEERIAFERSNLTAGPIAEVDFGESVGNLNRQPAVMSEETGGLQRALQWTAVKSLDLQSAQASDQALGLGPALVR